MRTTLTQTDVARGRTASADARASTPARAASAGCSSRRPSSLLGGRDRATRSSSAVVHVLPEGRRPGPGHRAVRRGRLRRASRTTRTGCSSSARPDGGTVPARRAPSARSSGTPLCVTLFFTVVTVAIEIVLGLWFAMIMNRTFKGRGLVRAAILVPVGHPHRRHRQAVVLHLRLRGHRQQRCCRTPTSCGPATTWPARFAVDHRRRLEDHAVHGAADPGRPADDPRRRLRGGQDRRRHARGSGSA